MDWEGGGRRKEGMYSVMEGSNRWEGNEAIKSES